MLAAGNTILLRGSDSTPIIADEIAAICKKSGFDNNEVQSIHTNHE